MLMIMLIFPKRTACNFFYFQVLVIVLAVQNGMECGHQVKDEWLDVERCSVVYLYALQRVNGERKHIF